MKQIFFLLFTFGVIVMTVVTCAPSHKPEPLPLSHITCNAKCPDDYRPVCAVDSMGVTRTFNSACYLDSFYCKTRTYYVIMKEGEC